MASQGDLLQLTDKQSLFGETVLNVYYYRVVPITGVADAEEFLSTLWQEQVLPAILNIQHPSLNHNNIRVLNLSDNLTFYEEVIDEDGTQGSSFESMPSYFALNYKLIRESLATRNGSKRFAGIPENTISANQWLNAGGANDVALATALAADLVSSAVTYFEPVIVKRPYVPPVGTGYIYSSIGAAQFTGISSQNTRKPGRGS